jgi:Fur family transcriptional regulator, ferric uptake regulator
VTREEGAPSRSVRREASVEQALGEMNGLCSAHDLYVAMRAQGHRIGLSTVYRHLQTLSAQGVAETVDTGNGVTTYRLGSEVRLQRAHRFVCRDCGRVDGVMWADLMHWIALTAKRLGYGEVDGVVEIRGLCGTCAKERGGARDQEET